MCHHYKGVRQPPAHLADEFSLRSNLYQLTLPDEGFYPLADVPIIRLDQAGHREMVAAQWGFLPGWWKPSEKTPKRASFQRKCINARSEEVDSKPTYRDAFRRRRCLMPASEFFERGFYFHLADYRPFAFAAMWDRWLGDDGMPLDTCTLLTTEPNSAVESVGHNRMPVIFTAEDQYGRWLNPELAERAALDDLMRPTPADWWQLSQAPPVEKSSARSTAKQEPESTQGLLF